MKKIFNEFKILNRSIPGAVFSVLILSIVMMNLLANKGLQFSFDWLVLDCGIIFSWVTFFLMDIVVKRFGLRAGNLLTIFALLTNLFIAILLIGASYIPGAWAESYVIEGGDKINNALNNTIRGSWYVLFGSSVAFLVSALTNNFLNNWIGEKVDKKGKFKGFIIRSYISTFVGQFIDNLVFALIVSINFFGWTISQAIICAITGGLVELFFEIIFSPLAFRVCQKWDQEQVGIEYLNYLEKEKKSCEF